VHLAELKRHRLVAALLLAVAAAILIRAANEGSLTRAMLYLTAIGISLFSVDVTLARWPPDGRETTVRSAGGELALAALFFGGAFGWLYARFVVGYQPAPGLLRMAWLALLLGCVFNAFLALFLIARRYGLADLGLRASGVVAVPAVIATFAVTALVFARSNTTWAGILEESGGSWLAVLATALTAAVPEEFFRFVWQTRVGTWLGNRAAGWLVASLVWATLHAPKDWAESHSIAATVMGVLNIVPLGLLWGYLTHRTRNMVPSILLHMTNLWGLQNLP
jgi:membrane protease YdiL (CAAX protease family)